MIKTVEFGKFVAIEFTKISGVICNIPQIFQETKNIFEINISNICVECGTGLNSTLSKSEV